MFLEFNHLKVHGVCAKNKMVYHNLQFPNKKKTISLAITFNYYIHPFKQPLKKVCVLFCGVLGGTMKFKECK